MQINIDVLENLMPNVLTVVTQLCATMVMFLLLKKFAWEPVKKIMNTRAAYEQQRLEEAEKLKQENLELRAQMDKQLADASRKAQETIQNAQLEGQRMKENLVSEGRERSKQLIDEAEHSIELERAKMLDEMHEEIVDVALGAAEKMLSEKLDEESDRRYIDSFIKEVTGQ